MRSVFAGLAAGEEDGVVSEEELQAAGRREVESLLVDQSWIEEWQAGAPDLPDDAVEWLRSRPACIHALMIEFPPSCIVRAKLPLCIPSYGTRGIVTSYSEPSDEYPHGLISVRQSPTAGVRGQCDPGALIVVGYWRGVTPDVVRKLLEGATP